MEGNKGVWSGGSWRDGGCSLGSCDWSTEGARGGNQRGKKITVGASGPASVLLVRHPSFSRFFRYISLGYDLDEKTHTTECSMNEGLTC